MAVSPQVKLDARALRADFPILSQPMYGKTLAYLDSSNSSHKPRQVMDAERRFYETSYANVHRALYELGERATAEYEGAREKVRAFVNAETTREIIFTRGATEAINLVANAWGLDNLGPGDLVVSTELEHHSNFVPWQYVAGRTGAEFAVIPAGEDGELRLDALDELAARGRVKVVAVGYVNNSLGTVNPLERVTAWAREQGAITVVDACQAAPHRRMDVQTLGVDFLAFTGHKMCAPTGIGALWGRADLLESMAPYQTGGDMIRSVSVEKTTWNELPHKFEAGTPPFAQAVGLGAAIDYLDGIGLEAIEAHEAELTAYALARLGEIPGIKIYGAPLERRGGIVSFDVEGVHPHDVAQIVGWEGVAVRAGHHCTQPLMHRLGISATTRASFYLYNLPEEIDALADGLLKVKDTFK